MEGSQIELIVGCMTPDTRDGEDLDESVAKTRVCFIHLCEASFGEY